jgi:hypothetical protein
VQLFDTADSAADTVAGFVTAGLLAGDGVVLAMLERGWTEVAGRLRANGVAVDEAAAAGRLIAIDAADLLSRLIRRGHPDSGQFHAIVGSLVTAVGSTSGRVRVYGEMVDLLARSGEYRALLELEALWNELAAELPFTLLCGYSAEHFGDPRLAETLAAVCCAHSVVRSNPRDALGAFLMTQPQPRGRPHPLFERRGNREAIRAAVAGTRG